MSVTIRDLANAAKQCGYQGPDTDAAKMKAFLLGLKAEDGTPEPAEEIIVKGVTYKVADLVFDSKPTTKRPRSLVIAGSDELPEDTADKLKSMVDERLKAMGIDQLAGKRPGHVQVGTVKSGEERMYEARINRKQSVFSKYDYALGFGRDIQVKALRALGRGDEAQALYNKTAEYLTQKGYTLLNTAAGQALVPEGYDADLHQLLLEFGVARKSARVVPMTTETVSRPKATGDLTMYYPADGSAGTESTKTWSNVQMRAKEGMVIVKASRAILQDSAINIADDAGRDIVRCAGKQEDNSLFNSNGSGATNGYIPQTSGILFQIGAGGASASTPWVQTAETSTNSRVYKSTATTPLGVTVSDVVALMSLPGNFVGIRPMFHCTQQIAAAVFFRLAASVGGIQPMQIEGLGMLNSFLGVPIMVNNVMSTSLATGSNRQLIVYGDLSLAADFGDRMGLTTEISEQRYWDENNIGIKGTVRHDINVHALGATGTAGPVAVLTQS